jgi:hypothetical protein
MGAPFTNKGFAPERRTSKAFGLLFTAINVSIEPNTQDEKA